MRVHGDRLACRQLKMLNRGEHRPRLRCASCTQTLERRVVLGCYGCPCLPWRGEFGEERAGTCNRVTNWGSGGWENKAVAWLMTRHRSSDGCMLPRVVNTPATWKRETRDADGRVQRKPSRVLGYQHNFATNHQRQKVERKGEMGTHVGSPANTRQGKINSVGPSTRF